MVETIETVIARKLKCEECGSALKAVQFNEKQWMAQCTDETCAALHELG